MTHQYDFVKLQPRHRFVHRLGGVIQIVYDGKVLGDLLPVSKTFSFFVPTKAGPRMLVNHCGEFREDDRMLTMWALRELGLINNEGPRP